MANSTKQKINAVVLIAFISKQQAVATINDREVFPLFTSAEQQLILSIARG